MIAFSYIVSAGMQPDPERPIESFVRTCTRPGYMVTKDALYESYKNYMESHDMQPMYHACFFKILKALYPNIKDTRPQVGKDRPRCLSGIHLYEIPEHLICPN